MAHLVRDEDVELVVVLWRQQPGAELAQHVRGILQGRAPSEADGGRAGLGSQWHKNEAIPCHRFPFFSAALVVFGWLVGENGERVMMCVCIAAASRQQEADNGETQQRERSRSRIRASISGSTLAGGQDAIAGAAQKQVQSERGGKGEGGGRC